MALNQKQLRVHVTEQFISDILVYIVVNIQLSFEWESVYCTLFFFRGHSNESCNLIGFLPGQYFPISAHGPR